MASYTAAAWFGMRAQTSEPRYKQAPLRYVGRTRGSAEPPRPPAVVIPPPAAEPQAEPAAVPSPALDDVFGPAREASR